MNKTVGSTLLVAGTMIGAGMLAMPLTSAGIGFGATLLLLFGLWALLTFTALLFVELYQTAPSDAGIGTLASHYFHGCFNYLFICFNCRLYQRRRFVINGYFTDYCRSRNYRKSGGADFHDFFRRFYCHRHS